MHLLKHAQSADQRAVQRDREAARAEFTRVTCSMSADKRRDIAAETARASMHREGWNSVRNSASDNYAGPGASVTYTQGDRSVTVTNDATDRGLTVSRETHGNS